MPQSGKVQTLETRDLFGALEQAAPATESKAHPLREQKPRAKTKTKRASRHKREAECNECEPTRVFLKDAEVAQRLGVSRQTIWKWAKTGGFPKPLQVAAGTSRWRVSDVLAYERGLQPVHFGKRQTRKARSGK